MKDRHSYGQTLDERTALALAIEKLRQLEELMGAMAQMKGDARWLTLSNLYGTQARDLLPKLAVRQLAS